MEREKALLAIYIIMMKRFEYDLTHYIGVLYNFVILKLKCLLTFSRGEILKGFIIQY